MEKTIRVTGRGILSLAPDSIRLELQLVDLSDTYADAMRRMAALTGQLQAALAAVGFAPDALKTSHMGVEERREGYQDDKGVWRERFLGYACTHAMTLTFPRSSERLSRTLTALSSCEAKPAVSVRYTMRDPERIKNELLGRAVADAAEKARRLAEAAGVALGEVRSIDYSWGQLELLSRTERSVKLAAAAGANDALSFDIEPEEIRLEDTVSVIWAIG